MDAAEKRPVETEETRERRSLKQVKEKSAYFRDAERDHQGQASPRCRLNALRLGEGECDGEGFQRFFCSSSPGSSMST